jgi:hypothetical protein
VETARETRNGQKKVVQAVAVLYKSALQASAGTPDCTGGRRTAYLMNVSFPVLAFYRLSSDLLKYSAGSALSVFG